MRQKITKIVLGNRNPKNFAKFLRIWKFEFGNLKQIKIRSFCPKILLISTLLIIARGIEWLFATATAKFKVDSHLTILDELEIQKQI